MVLSWPAKGDSTFITCQSRERVPAQTLAGHPRLEPLQHPRRSPAGEEPSELHRTHPTTWSDPRSTVVSAIRLLPGDGPLLRRQQRRRLRRPAGPDLAARLAPVAGCRCALAATVLRLAAARRRVD